jgi:hypothetical protein
MLKAFRRLSDNYTTTDNKYNDLNKTLKMYTKYSDEVLYCFLKYRVISNIVSISFIGPYLASFCMHYETDIGRNLIITKLQNVLNSWRKEYGLVSVCQARILLQNLHKILNRVIQNIKNQIILISSAKDIAAKLFNDFCEKNQTQLRIIIDGANTV